ncbi:MBL fold metallo-hydrolase [Erwinia sp. 9145]|uniref:MBL fold metallo-hydrolase n=1 Tax=Erwinia sp. 9145 TaxID=1500895 RepID=UPI000554329B|nr:MBL fold metallo-hydrolase [Erwinia sp. 9145]
MRFALRNPEKLAEELTATRVPDTGLAIWSLGQAGVVLKNAAGDLLAIDPYLSDAIERNHPGTEFVRRFPPVLPPQALSVCDAVLVSHFHDDHMDMGTLIPLAASAPTLPFWIPSPDAGPVARAHPQVSGNIRPAITGDAFFVGQFHVLPIAAAHSDYEKNADGHDRFLGYFITCDGVRFWHSGDTLVTPELQAEMKQHAPDIAMLPINGGDYARGHRGILPNMNFRDAADLNHSLGCDLLLPCHYDLFSCNSDNPAWFVDDILHRYPGDKFHLLMPGERLIYLQQTPHQATHHKNITIQGINLR